MKHFLIILVLAGWLPSGIAQEKGSAMFSPTEEICGFLGRFQYLRPHDVKQGLAVELFIGDAKVHQPVTLRFFAHERPRNFPVDDLQIEHEKLMHVVGVRDDLGEFFHIHPVRVSPGLWAVSHVFTNGGNYRIWSDVKYRGTSYAFEHPTLTVVGRVGNRTEVRPLKDLVDVSGYQIAIERPDALMAGKTNLLQFVVRNFLGSQIRTENFLGAPMHLVIIKDDLSVFLHAHSENHGSTDPTIYFRQMFPRKGRYKLFAQFRPNKIKLPQDEALLAEFFVEVAGSEPGRIVPPQQ